MNRKHPSLCALFRHGFILLLCAISCGALANPPGGGDSGPPVTAVLQGKNVVLANGLVTATIDGSSATVLSLRYKGHEMISQTGRHKTLYFFFDGDKGYERFYNCTLSVKTRNAETVDIVCQHKYSPSNDRMHPCDVDTHFVLRRGMTGLYIYTILNHPADYPDFNVGQYLMIWSMPETATEWLMEKIYVDDARHWEMPSPYDLSHGETNHIKEIYTLRTGPWKDRYDCKYMYTATYRDLGCWGFASDRNKIGAWLVFGNHEFFNDGPTMSDLTAATGILQLMFNMNHYNGFGLQIKHGEDWQKVYGPYLVYCNSNPAGGDACWADAQRQADAEKSAWPYDWLTGEKLYPLKDQRGSVSGTFIIKDPLKPHASGNGAWVGLNQPPPGGNWQLESAHYQYWVHADAAGNFTIPNVRPGTYTFSAFNTNAVGEYSQANVEVKAGETTSLGAVTWNVPHAGASIAWEIGVPDRSAKEFRHSQDYIQPYMWQKFASEFPNPLEYTVGVSDWSKDWNYVQSGYMSGTNWSPWKWRIHFNLTNAPASGDATLTLAYASSYYGQTEIYVNDEAKMLKLVHPAIDGGNAFIREGIHAKYWVTHVPIPMTLLHPGTNTLTLVQGQDRYNTPFYHVMYDYLDLELPAAK